MQTDGAAKAADQQDAERGVNLRAPEAAKYTGLSESQLAKMRMAGRSDGPPFVKICRSVIYRRRDLDAWLARNLVGEAA